ETVEPSLADNHVALRRLGQCDARGRQCAFLRHRASESPFQPDAEPVRDTTVARNQRAYATAHPLGELLKPQSLRGDARGRMLQAPREIVDPLHFTLE